MYYTVKKVPHKINFDIVVAFKVRLILYIDTKCKNEFPRLLYLCIIINIIITPLYIWDNYHQYTICYEVWSS